MVFVERTHLAEKMVNQRPWGKHIPHRDEEQDQCVQRDPKLVAGDEVHRYGMGEGEGPTGLYKPLQ